MADISIDGAKLSGVLRLTWVADDLAHVLEHSQTDETTGTWTGLACPDHGLAIGTDVDNATLQRLPPTAKSPTSSGKPPPASPPSTASSASPRSRPTKPATTRLASGSGSRPALSGPVPGQRTTRRSSSCRTQA